MNTLFRLLENTIMTASRPLFLCLLLVFLPLGSLVTGCGGGDEKHASAQKETWTCPMHPTVLSDRPGACPVCNMALVKKAEEKPLSPEDAAMLASVTLSPTQRLLANVTTVPVRRGEVSRTLSVPGVVDFAEPLKAVVSARTRGRIEKLLVNATGVVVRKGQPLAELYSPDLIAAQQELLSALRAPATGSTSGGLGDFQDRLVTAARDRLRHVFGLSESQIADIERSGRVSPTMSFVAPIGGTVIRKSVVEGQYVSESTELYQLADLSRVWAWVEVAETDLRFVTVGRPATVTAEAWPGDTFAAKVTFIDPVLNASTRTARVRVELPNPGGRLRPQMFVRAALSLSSSSALLVPDAAVVRTGTRDLVWVEVRENQFEPRVVRLGTRSAQDVEILSGLSEGDQVVASGGYLLDSESQLKDPAAWKNVKAASSPNETDARGDVQTVSVTVEGGYAPETIRVKMGRPVRLLFTRNEESKCSEEVVISEYKIRKYLPAYKTTPVEFTPTRPGKFRMTCGMDMIEGFIVVEK